MFVRALLVLVFVVPKEMSLLRESVRFVTYEKEVVMQSRVGWWSGCARSQRGEASSGSCAVMNAINIFDKEWQLARSFTIDAPLDCLPR